MPDAKARLFVAVEVPASVRDSIEAAVDPLRRRQPDLRWVTPAIYHLTLAFVGWVDDEGARAVAAACRAAASQVGPFELTLTGDAGTFGSGVAWARLADSDALAALAAAVRGALAAHGLEVETRPFHGHITVARAGRGSRIRPGLAESYDGPRSAWRVERVALMRSRLRRSGPLYSVEAAWLLDG